MIVSKFKSLLYQGTQFAVTYRRARSCWHGRVAYDQPKVYYGRDHIPGKDENACGGIIKAQDLQSVYPNRKDQPNILYLISSALPAYAATMVRQAKKHGAKIVLNQNGTAYPAWHGPGWEKTNRPMRKVLELADYVFYQSQFCKTAADLHLLERNDGFEILHNPVDCSTFVPSQYKPTGHRLISAGTHNQLYRVQCAIETAVILKRSIPDIQLTFAGRYHWRNSHAESMEELEALVESSGIAGSITVLGPYSQNEVVPLMQEHHVALHTKYNDPCPRLVTEALACGLPVVYSDSGGVPELVGRDAGIGVPAPLDWQDLHAPAPDQLAEAVVRVFEKYDAFSAAARRRSIEHLDVGPWLERHKQIFSEIIR